MRYKSHGYLCLNVLFWLRNLGEMEQENFTIHTALDFKFKPDNRKEFKNLDHFNQVW